MISSSKNWNYLIEHLFGDLWVDEGKAGRSSRKMVSYDNEKSTEQQIFLIFKINNQMDDLMA